MNIDERGALNLVRYLITDCFSNYCASSDADLKSQYAKHRLEYINSPILDLYCDASGDDSFSKKQLRKMCYDFHFNKKQFQKQTEYYRPGDNKIDQRFY